MTEQEQKQMGFREWTEHYEKEQEVDRDKVNRLADGLSMLSQDVGQLTANVKVLMDNQKGMFNRMNRPWQWGVVITAFVAIFSLSGMFATVLTLTVNPLKDALAEVSIEIKSERANQMEINMWLRDEIDAVEAKAIRNAADSEWFKKMEERGFNRAHVGE